MSKQKSSVDVAIIGGGVIGCAIGWYLTKRGMSVGVYEKGRVAGEQSGKNSGFVRKQGRDAREMPLIKRSLDLWHGINEDIAGETGFTESGNLAVASTPEKLALMRTWLGVARDFDVDSTILEGKALSEIVPRLRPGFSGALYTPSDCRAEPGLAAPAIAKALRLHGADIRESCHVQGLLIEGGKVAGIVTEDGEVRARTVVVAAGLWTGLFLARYGIHVPQSDLKISVGRTAPFDHGLTIPAWTKDVLVRPRFDGGLTIAMGMLGAADFETTLRSLRQAGRFLPSYLANRSGVQISVGKRLFEGLRWNSAYVGKDVSRYDEIRVPKVAPNNATLDFCAASARRDFQFKQDITLAERWACRVDVTPDGVPVIGEAPTLPGLMIATGMSGHGFGISLGVGDTLAEFIDTGSSAISLSEFRLQRFAERYFASPQSVL